MVQQHRWKVGDSVQLTKTFGAAEIEKFAELTGDRNPLHMDEAFATRTRFKRRIAQGILSASLISTCIGMHLPGTGAIYLGQTLRFVKPVYVGDTVTLTATVSHIREDKPLLTLTTIWTNQHGQKVIEGEAHVLLMSPEEMALSR
jgi:3-hydroxybutyryl-CoA dehydratase